MIHIHWIRNWFPAFWWIRFQVFESQKLENIAVAKDSFRPPWRTFKLREQPPVLKREHPALQNIIFFYCFLFFVWHFCLTGAFSQTQLNPRIRIRYIRCVRRIPVKIMQHKCCFFFVNCIFYSILYKCMISPIISNWPSIFQSEAEIWPFLSGIDSYQPFIILLQQWL